MLIAELLFASECPLLLLAHGLQETLEVRDFFARGMRSVRLLVFGLDLAFDKSAVFLHCRLPPFLLQQHGWVVNHLLQHLVLVLGCRRRGSHVVHLVLRERV